MDVVFEPETSDLYSPLFGFEVHHIEVEDDLMSFPSLLEHPNKQSLHRFLHGYKLFQMAIRTRSQLLNGISLRQLILPPMHALNMIIRIAVITLEHMVLLGLHHGAGLTTKTHLTGR